MARTTSKSRLQSGAACEPCRKRKSRCNAIRPQCSNCNIRNISCRYGNPYSQLSTPQYSSQPAVNADELPPTSERASSQSFSRTIGTDYAQSRRRDHGENETNGPAGILSLSSTATGDDSVPSVGLATTGSHVINSTISRQRHVKRPYEVLAAEESDAPETHYKGSSTFPSITLFSRNEIEGLPDAPTTLESHSELPDRLLADSLVDTYFKRTHKLYPFLHEGTFRAEYEALWARPSSRPSSRLSWFGLLNMVFVHGCEYCDTVPQDQALAHAATFFSRSKSILVSQLFALGSLESVQSLLLMCYYLQGTIDLHQCWNLLGLMVRIATSVGLHSKLGQDDIIPVEREVRKRTWWGCVVLNYTLSMKFGCPPLLRADESNVEFPLEVDDQYIINTSVTSRQPNGSPSFISFFVNSIQLAHIVHNVSEMLYSRRPHTQDQNANKRDRTQQTTCSYVLSKIVTLDGQLQAWLDNLPRHLAEESSEREQSWIDFRGQQTALKIR